jgi:hypothetical protein
MRYEEFHRSKVKQLLVWSDSYCLDSERSYFETLGLNGRELEDRSKKRFYQESVERFLRFNLVPREIFNDLAVTTPSTLSSAFVARRYASRIAGISVGTASHKAVGKKTE